MPSRILLQLLILVEHCRSERREVVAGIVKLAQVETVIHSNRAEGRSLIVLAVGVCLARLKSYTILASLVAMLANAEYLNAT